MSRARLECAGNGARRADAADDPQLVARLDHAVAALCRGSTGVIGPAPARIAGALQARGFDRVRAVTTTPASALDDLRRLGTEAVRTLVLEDLLPDDAAARTALLESAFASVKSGGRLVVIAPHARAVDTAGALQRRELERLLQPLGKTRLGTEQPYSWLVMYVRKREDGIDAVPATVAERYRVIAGLCRGAVLELGCGRGQLADTIASRGHAVTGIDLNAGKIAAAGRRYPHIRFLQGDAAGLPDIGCFDTVVIAEVLEHVDDDTGARILASARRALARDGRLVVSVPNGKCIPHPNHIRRFDERALRTLLKGFGTPRSTIDQPFKWLIMYVDIA